MQTTVGRVGETQGVYIGRAGHGHDGYFGNPFVLTNENERETVLSRFREYFADRLYRDPEYRERIEGLRGQRLLCFCTPRACHGDVIADYLNGGEQREG